MASIFKVTKSDDENIDIDLPDQNVQDTEECPLDDITKPKEDDLNQNTIADELSDDLTVSNTPDVQDSETTAEDPVVLANADFQDITTDDQIKNSNEEPYPDNNDEENISTTDAIEKSYEESKQPDEEEVLTNDVVPFITPLLPLMN